LAWPATDIAVAKSRKPKGVVQPAITPHEYQASASSWRPRLFYLLHKAQFVAMAKSISPGDVCVSAAQSIFITGQAFICTQGATLGPSWTIARNVSPLNIGVTS